MNKFLSVARLYILTMLVTIIFISKDEIQRKVALPISQLTGEDILVVAMFIFTFCFIYPPKDEKK